MRGKILPGFLLLSVSLAASGCVAALAGAGGSVFWQGGKVISEESSTREKAVSAVKAAFNSNEIKLTDELTKKKVSQLRGEDASQTKVAVDVFETGEKTVRVEIRYGLGEKTAARDLLTDVKKGL